MIIGIIGGGASGMAAALAAGENRSNYVILFERQARLGRKLQATGNGRCNLTNLNAEQGGYHGENPSFSQTAINTFPPSKTLAWFSHLGLYTVAEPSGRVYPYSDQANSVVDVLRFALEQSGVEVKTGFEAEKVKHTNGGFLVESKEETVFCDKLVIACGGLAGSKLGGTMSGYKLLRSLGHHCTRLRPALVQIKTSWSGITALKGVRANCKAEIFRDHILHSASEGELQFTEIGLSGPVIFEISRDVCQQKGNWTCRLDFLPNMDLSELIKRLSARKETTLPASELFTGILHNRLGRIITQSVGIGSTIPISDLSLASIEDAAKTAKSFIVTLTEPLGMDSAQVTAGGILTDEFCSSTMESKQIPGLFACGEVLDVDGDCGGYNLQWAWSSGRLAGLHAGKETK